MFYLTYKFSLISHILLIVSPTHPSIPDLIPLILRLLKSIHNMYTPSQIPRGMKTKRDVDKMVVFQSTFYSCSINKSHLLSTYYLF